MDRHAASPVRRARLKRFLLLYCAFLAVASLLPMSGLAPLSNWSTAFLSAPWPRYITRTDLATNLLVYLPLGYALALWFARPGRRATGMALGALGGLALSFVLESGQQLVPGRIASNLDMLVNGLGALSGALLALHHGRWLRALTAAERWRADWFRADRGATLGLALLGLWFATQFSLLPLPGIGWLHLHLRPFDRLPDSLEGLNLPWLLAQFLEIATVGAFVACLVVGGAAMYVRVQLMARMGAVCDVYDAVTSQRAYNRGWDPADALRQMAGWRGHFDPHVFQAFVRAVGIYPTGSLVRLASGRLGVVIEQGKTSLLAPRVRVFFSAKSREPVPVQVIEPGGSERIVAREDPAQWGFERLDEHWAAG